MIFGEIKKRWNILNYNYLLILIKSFKVRTKKFDLRLSLEYEGISYLSHYYLAKVNLIYKILYIKRRRKEIISIGEGVVHTKGIK